MKRTLAAIALLLAATTSLAGCRHERDDKVLDQCERTKLFHQCMAELPAGPVQTKYNDWDEVIGTCDTTAMYQSVKPRFSVKPECTVE